jgi:hypothetical protein
VPELQHAHGAQWKLLQVCQLREHKRLLLRGRGTGWMSRNGSTNVLTCPCIVSTYVLTYCRKEKKAWQGRELERVRAKRHVPTRW